MHRQLLTALLSSAGFATSVAAETLTVCAAGCDYTSIIAAIDEAVDGSTIQLFEETYVEDSTIQISGSNAITIIGATDDTGSPASLIDGGGQRRVLKLTGNVDVTLENLVIQNGRFDDVLEPYGAGIYADQDYGGTLSMDNCTVTGNTAHTGAGLYLGDGTIVLNYCTIQGNSGLWSDSICCQLAPSEGAGLYVGPGDADVTLIECVVTENIASGAFGEGLGTGIHAYRDAILTLSGTSICANSEGTGETTDANQLVSSSGAEVKDIDGNCILAACDTCDFNVDGTPDECDTDIDNFPGVFARIDRFDTSDSNSVALGDFDGDGDLDAIFANQGDYDAEANTIWLNDGYGSFSEYGSGLGDRFSTAVAIGDIDADGDLDAVFANAYGSPNTVWFNQGTGEFIDSEARLGNSRSTSVGLDDLDGDGYLDVFFTNSGQPNTVWLNDGTGHFEEFGTGLGNQKSHAVALGDVDGDGDIDAAVSNFNQPGKVWLNNGDGSFLDSGVELDDNINYSVDLGDLDGDGYLDIVLGSTYGEANTVWINDGQGDFTKSETGIGSSVGRSHLALGDLDGDGNLDVVDATRGEANTVWLNDGQGYFSDSGEGYGNQDSMGVALGDLDGDGDLDAMIANGGTDQNAVWINLGTGRDCNENGTLDSCEITDEPSLDSDGDGILNDCDICEGGNDFVDLDGDSVPDFCDICIGFDDTIDSDSDGQPDGCDQYPVNDIDNDGILDSEDDQFDLVPGVPGLINTAIAVADDGDVIQLEAGIYYEGSTIDTLGKAITIIGTADGDGLPISILDGGNPEGGTSGIRVLICQSGESGTTVFQDLVIQNGYSTNGGGMYNYQSSPTLTGCTFTNNSARFGGAMTIFSSSPIMTDCTFTDNSAEFNGGGISNYSGRPNLTNCSFTGNSAENGGGMNNDSYGRPTLTDCTFKDNLASEDGGGIFNDDTSSPTLNSSILCGNSPDQVVGAYTDLGDNCITESCEQTDENGIPNDCESCPGDVTGDGQVDGADLATILGWWGTDDSAADINGDGDVNGADLSYVLGYWGLCPAR